MNTILRNVILGISLAAPLGPSAIAVMQNGLKFGFTRAFLTGVGVTLADVTYLLVVYFGVSSFITIPAVKAVIWVLGALVLLYLGAQSIRDAVRGVDLSNTTAASTKNPLLVGYLVTISNPLSVVFWVGIYGSMLGASGSDDSSLQVLLTSSAILVGILLWHSTMSLLTNWGKRFLNETTAKVVSLVAGLSLILFGIGFAYNVVSMVF